MRGGWQRVSGVLLWTARQVVSLPKYALLLVLRLYQLVLSPLLTLITAPGYGQTCRFYPSCSDYAVTAVSRFGVLRGGWLALRRLGRCNPWNPGGVDHVPSRGGSTRGSDHLVPLETDEAAVAAAHDGRADTADAGRPAVQCDRHAA